MTANEDVHKSFKEAFDVFNLELFGGRLPIPLITFRASKNSTGFFKRHGFKGRVNKSAYVDEIALNPAAFQDRSDELILSDFVHQMFHFYQYVYGDPKGKDGYHDREWATLMIECGLIPVSKNGRQTGYKVSHYIKEGGKFQRVCQKLLATDFRLPWEAVDKYDPKQKRGEQGGAADTSKQGRIKFTCPVCGLNAWAKDSAELWCGLCLRHRRSLPKMRAADWDEELQEWTLEELNKLDLVPVASPGIRGLMKSSAAAISQR